MKSVAVTLDDGSIVEYQLRGLEECEIQTWAKFCASVFSYKANPPPPSYFERHYYNDPLRVSELVRVAIFEGDIVSSTRIFQKRVALGTPGETATAGGIGEVCTHSLHRNRGLAKLLLEEAIEIMKSRSMQLSLLHSAETFFRVYERGGGYACTLSRWSVVTIDTNQLAKSGSTRPASIPDDTPCLHSLHREYSENRFAGCIVRSQDYWNQYLSKELEGSFFVLCDEDSSIVAWMSLRLRGERFQLREFGCDRSRIVTKTALSQLLHVCLRDCTYDTLVALHMPTFILEEMEETPVFIQQGSIQEENDLGWMYLTLKPGGVDMVTTSQTRPHLIWPSDSF